MLDKVKKIFPNVDKFNIFEGSIDTETQTEYFDYVINKRKDLNEDEIIKQKDNIFDNEFDIEEKKYLIANLASIPEVEVFRTLEKYAQNPDDELKFWIEIALQENKAFLKSELLDEKQIFISTGLGGEENKLRYFVVLISDDQEDFSDVQKRIITSEIKYYFKNNSSKLEKVEFGKYFVTILTLFPLDASVHKIFSGIISEINELGNFMSQNFIISNVKALDLVETEELISKLLKKEKDLKNNLKDIL